MNCNVVAFPLGQVLDWRAQNRVQAERNRLESIIRTKEQEIARLAHQIWLHKLELEGLRNG